jgi:phosphoglycerate dehydrogenase-like enzyme
MAFCMACSVSVSILAVAHIGAFTKEANEKMALKSAENLIKMLK